jgi:hypothetical protein
VNEKDIQITAAIMREQHGEHAEEFVRQQIHYYRTRPALSATWKAVLAALVTAAPVVRYAKSG